MAKSAASQYDPLPEDQLNAPELPEAFDQAQAAETPIEQRDQPEPPAPRNREGLEGTSLADAPDMGQAFDGAGQEPSANDNDYYDVDLAELRAIADGIEADQGQQSGSQMVQDQGMDPFPSPSSEIKDPVHRGTFDEQWQAEVDRAAADPAYMAEVEAAMENVEEQDQGQDQQQDMGR